MRPLSTVYSSLYFSYRLRANWPDVDALIRPDSASKLAMARTMNCLVSGLKTRPPYVSGSRMGPFMEAK
jgi:hypothetical protein